MYIPQNHQYRAEHQLRNELCKKHFTSMVYDPNKQGVHTEFILIREHELQLIVNIMNVVKEEYKDITDIEFLQHEIKDKNKLINKLNSSIEMYVKSLQSYKEHVSQLKIDNSSLRDELREKTSEINSLKIIISKNF